MREKQKYIVPLVLFALTIWFTLNLLYEYAMICFFGMFVIIIVMAFKRMEPDEETDSPYNVHVTRSPCNVYYGNELQFTDQMMDACLAKHQPYYLVLNDPEKQRFLQRLKKFIRTKTFKIHNSTGFREMPILISSSAIQLSFGLDSYLLPQFEFIHIYPEEFIHDHATFNFLEGNVSGQSINISWKHFLQGYEIPTDGQNVGLHEMAHAYYYQNFISKDDIDNCFVNGFPQFDNHANKAFEQEKIPGNDLYSDYALKNFQEFWAESIEIFFEKPIFLNTNYPELYTALKSLLRQDPLNNKASMAG
jgi:Mlc titration factor MtfA (ptsG expression regulator)